MQKLSMEIGELKGKLTEKDKKIEEYVTLLQGRNPETDKFMKDTLTILSEIKVFIQELNETNKRRG